MTACKLCGSANTAVFKHIGKQDLIRCRDCKVIFIHPFPKETKIRRTYETDELGNCRYYSENRELDVKSFDKRLDIIESVTGKKPVKVLDFGCSTGSFMEAALNRGYDPVGKELNKNSLEACRKRGLKAYLDVRGSEYDMMHAGDLIEHLPDPKKFLSEAKRLIKHGGYLVLSTPDIGKMYANFMQIKPDEHLFYFTKQSMRKLLEDSGFSVVYIKSSSRKRSMKNLEFSSTSRQAFVRRSMDAINAVHAGKIVDFVMSNLRDDMLVIARNG